MCLFVGILFLIGLPITVASGTFSGDPLLFGLLWVLGALALMGRVWQTMRR